MGVEKVILINAAQSCSHSFSCDRKRFLYLTLLSHQTRTEGVRQHQLTVAFLFLVQVPKYKCIQIYLSVTFSVFFPALTGPFVWLWRSFTLINLQSLLLSALSSAVADNLRGEKKKVSRSKTCAHKEITKNRRRHPQNRSLFSFFLWPENRNFMVINKETTKPDKKED